LLWLLREGRVVYSNIQAVSKVYSRGPKVVTRLSVVQVLVRLLFRSCRVPIRTLFLAGSNAAGEFSPSCWRRRAWEILDSLLILKTIAVGLHVQGGRALALAKVCYLASSVAPTDNQAGSDHTDFFSTPVFARSPVATLTLFLK